MRVDWERMLMGFSTQVNLLICIHPSRETVTLRLSAHSAPDNTEDLGCCCVHITNPLHD